MQIKRERSGLDSWPSTARQHRQETNNYPFLYSNPCHTCCISSPYEQIESKAHQTEFLIRSLTLQAIAKQFVNTHKCAAQLDKSPLQISPLSPQFSIFACPFSLKLFIPTKFMI